MDQFSFSHLKPYYMKAVVIPGIIVIILSFILMIYFMATDGGENQYVGPGLGLFLGLIFLIKDALMVCLLALPIFLNTKKEIRENLLLNLASWFLLPGFYFGNMYFNILRYMHFETLGIEHLMLFINTAFYIGGLIYSYWKFRTDEVSHGHET